VSKIEIARKALKNVVKEWSPNVELGVTAYGHRKKGDCNDIENIIPVGKVDKNKVIKTVMSIQPKGKTPISRSLRKAAEALKYTEEKATIILISDGKETCDADPCAAAKELEKKGIDFVTHVIGFNVDKKTDKQLECIAHATGGEYFSAKNATALNKAMKRIVKKVEVVKPKPVVKKLKKNLEVTASETEGGKWVSAIHYIHYIVDGEKDKQVTNCWSEKDKSCLEKLPVGKYIMVSEYNKFKKETPIEIKADEVLKVNVVMGQTGKIEITASETEGGKWVSAIHYIHYIVDGEKEEQVTNCWSEKKESCIQQIPVGKYIMVSEYNEFKKETPIEIKADEVLKINVVIGQTGKIEITASETEGGKWVSAIHYIHYIVDGEKEEQVTNCWSEKKESCIQQIPVGKYIMVSEYNEFKKETPIEIKAEETNRVNVIFSQTNKVIISASETEDGKWIEAHHDIYKMEDGEKGSHVTSCWSHKKEECIRQIPLGKYLLKSSYNKFNNETYFEIKADEATKINIVMGETGKVEIIASKTEGGKWVEAHHDIYYMEDGEKGSHVTSCWSHKKEECIRQIPVGKYLLKSTYNQFKKETPFEVKAKKMTKLRVIFGQFVIKSICTDVHTKVGYEVYARSGRMVYDTSRPCGEIVQLTLDSGDYSVEASMQSSKKEVKFTVGGTEHELLLDLTNLNHEEAIKEDTPMEHTLVTEKKVKQKRSINTKIQNELDQTDMKEAAKGLGQLGALLGQMGKAVNGDNSKEIQEAGAFLKALGGLVDPEKTKAIKEEIAHEKEVQKIENKKADKAFDEMSQELEMFTK
jgi:hypothetical protein